jgi:hypothetical protein
LIIKIPKEFINFNHQKLKDMTDKDYKNHESFRVSGDEIFTKFKEIINEGNARKIIILNDRDDVIMEFPLTIGAIGVVLAPMFAAVGALAALAMKCTIVVEKKDSTEQKD